MERGLDAEERGATGERPADEGSLSPFTGGRGHRKEPMDHRHGGFAPLPLQSTAGRTMRASTFVLTANVDEEGPGPPSNFSRIGPRRSGGVFDGNGHTISGLSAARGEGPGGPVGMLSATSATSPTPR